jgi:hypothetical protein
MERQFYFNEALGWYEEVPVERYQHCLSGKELLEIFPEVREIIPQKIEEWQEIKEEIIKNKVKPYLKRVRKIEDDSNRWFWREGVKVLFGVELAEAVNNIQRLKRLELTMNYKPNKVGKVEDFEAKTRSAKEIPILNIASSFIQLRKSGANYVALCPFHSEKSPSFYIYPNTNSFYCFGCQKGGDSIDFIQLSLNCNFREAINYLKGEKNEYEERFVGPGVSKS